MKFRFINDHKEQWPVALVHGPKSMPARPWRRRSDDANGSGFGDPDHSVEHLHSERSLPLLIGKRAGAKA